MAKIGTSILIIALVGFLSLISIGVFVNPSFAQNEKLEWGIQNVDQEGKGPTSIVLDSNGRPHIVYNRVYRGIKYARWNGNKLITENVEANADGDTDISLALDSNDNPHISYANFTRRIDRHLKYAHFDGNSWNIQKVDTTGPEKNGDLGRFSSIAIDNSGNPHIAYTNDSSGNLTYAHFDGNSWNIQRVDVDNTLDFDDPNNLCCSFTRPSIAIDSNGNPHISYHNSSGLDLKYASFDGNSWSIHTIEDKPDALSPGGADDGEVGEYSSIAIDSNGNPHISYSRTTESLSKKLKYAHFDGNSWNIQIVDNQGDVGEYSSIAIDSNGNPHISYFNESSFSLKYASWNSSQNQWNIETVLQKSFKDGTKCCLSRGTHTSIALDSNDTPYISYENLSAGGIEYVSKGLQGQSSESIVDKYNNNNKPGIQGNEVRTAINDFLFRGEITGKQVRKVINVFLFG